MTFQFPKPTRQYRTDFSLPSEYADDIAERKQRKNMSDTPFVTPPISQTTKRRTIKLPTKNKVRRKLKLTQQKAVRQRRPQYFIDVLLVYHYNRKVAQLVERKAVVLEVGGSKPLRAIILFILFFFFFRMTTQTNSHMMDQ